MEKKNKCQPKYVMKFRTDKFFVFVYVLVAAMLVLQIALIAWGYFL